MSHLHSRLFGLLFCAPDAFQHTNLRYSSCQVCVTVEEMQDQDTMNMEGDHPCTVDVPAKRAKVHADVMDGPRATSLTCPCFNWVCHGNQRRQRAACLGQLT